MPRCNSVAKPYSTSKLFSLPAESHQTTVWISGKAYSVWVREVEFTPAQDSAPLRKPHPNDAIEYFGAEDWTAARVTIDGDVLAVSNIADDAELASWLPQVW